MEHSISSKARCLCAAAVICALSAVTMAAAAGIEGALTQTRVIELSGAGMPDICLAATRVAEEEAKLIGAQVRTLENPKLDLAAGPRNGEQSTFDAEVGLEIPVELGARREKRIALAQAGILREKHGVEDVRRRAVTAALAAYYRVLHAEENLAVARERKQLAEELVRIATERLGAGDAAKFEVNLAQTELIRAESEISSALGKREQARTALARTLGLPAAADLQVEGTIRDRNLFDAIRSAAPRERPDLLAARADLVAAEAAVSLAKAEQLPDLALRLSYQREGDENIALAGISVALPFVNPRRGPVLEAQAHRERARIAAEALKATVTAEQEGARRTYDAAIESVNRLERDGLALQHENESLAAESYRAGKITLSTLIQIRRELLETRREYLDRLLEAADAGVELAAARGIWSTN